MSTYFARDRTIQAVQWTGTNPSEVRDFVGYRGDGFGGSMQVFHHERFESPQLYVEQDDRWVDMITSQWIMPAEGHAKGFYILEDAVFRSMYDENPPEPITLEPTVILPENFPMGEIHKAIQSALAKDNTKSSDIVDSLKSLGVQFTKKPEVSNG